MKKLLLLAALILTIAASSFATVITVASTQIPNYTYGGTTATLRIYPNVTFVTSTSSTILGGTTAGFYKTIGCTVSTEAGPGVNVSFLECPSFTIDSTMDSSVPTVRYTALLYDSVGRQRATYFANFRVPTTLGTSVTWEQLRIYNQATVSTLPNTYYTAAQTDQAIATAVSGTFSGKQDTLVNQTNIKSVANHSLVGAGNVALVGSDVAVDPNVGLPGVTNAQQDLDALYTRSAPELPSQSTHGGQYLTTDGAVASWAAVGGGGGGGGGTTTVYLPTTYGATGDGSHDDGPAIQSAISAACIAGNGTVFLAGPPAPVPTHFWTFANPLYIPQGCTGLRIVGVGGYALDSINETDPVVYTGTVGPAIRVNQTNGLYVAGIDWRYSNASFTGDFFNLDASSTVVATFTRSSGNIFTTATTAGVYTGSKATVATSGSLPSGISGGTPYFIIKLSGTTFSLATSYANAVAGTAVTITSAGTGTQTITAAEDGNVTLHSVFENNSFKSFGAARAAGAGSSRSHINLAGSITTSILHNSFEFAKYGIIGFTSTDRDHFATTVALNRNFHRNATIAAIANHDQGWYITSDWFEHIYPTTGGLNTGVAGAYINPVESTARSPDGLTFAGCWFGDTGPEGGIWITYSGSGLNVTHSYFELGSLAEGVKLVSGGETYNLDGNKVNGTAGSTWLDAQDTTYSNVCDQDTNEVINTVTRNAAGNKYSRGCVAEYTVASDIATHANVNGVLQNLSSLTIPGAIFYRNGEKAIFEANGVFAANGNNKQVTLDDGAAEFDSGVLTDNNTAWSLTAEITYTGTTNGQAKFTFTHGGTTVVTHKTYGGLTWASSIGWAIKVQGTAANDITMSTYTIRKRNP